MNDFANKVEALLEAPMIPNHIARAIRSIVSEMRNAVSPGDPAVAAPEHPAVATPAAQ